MVALNFAVPVVNWTGLLLFMFALIIEAIALVSCLTQRSDAFQAVGTLPKGLWVALNAGGVVVTLLFNWSNLLGLIGLIAAAVYLLDIRPAIRDLASGTGTAW